MWDRRSNRIDVAKRRNEPTAPDVGPISSAMYCTGLKACKFKKAEIDKMFCMKFIEPAKSQ